MTTTKYIRQFSQIHKEDIPQVGGKGANLGEMANAGFPVPPGFAVTSKAYFDFLEKNHLTERISRQLHFVNATDPTSFGRVSQEIQKIINTSDIPQDLIHEIFQAYATLGGIFHNPLVAVRSSATAEDLPGASFAGQQETFLNVKGEATLVQKIRSCWASLFTARAIFYRQEKGFNHFKVGISVIIQKMIQSDTSGVMFTTNPVNNDKSVIVIEAILGLGELIVQGAVTPDHFEVEKSSLSITKKILGKQTEKMVHSETKNIIVKLPEKLGEKQKISHDQVIALAHLGKKIQHHYFYPQDIEWAIENGQFYIIQSRPITTLENKVIKVESGSTKKLKLLVKGEGASVGLSSGYANIIHSAREIGKIKNGDVLVTEMTTPDFVPAMRKAGAIVTDKGGQTSHAAIVSREMGLPCVVGTGNATKVLKAGKVVTVNGKTGEVFEGSGAVSHTAPVSLFAQNQADNLTGASIRASDEIPVKTATKVYVNLAEPELAAKVASANCDGVGLLRAEFMIAQIGTHPRKLIEDGKRDFFVNSLAEGMATFCKAFAPRPVVYRATDFKTNEYASLKGGEKYEPQEANPLLGFRGAYRYIADETVFGLELAAIKKVRNKMDLRNIYLMIPFVRTVHEMQEVKRIVLSHGLERTHTFKLWMMVEIPSNVILLEDYLKLGIDGVSVGSNDLTMLLLGLDRDNATIAKEFDERNPAVLWAMEKIVKTCKANNVTCSVCGQAPSRYPEFTKKLVSWGITSVSVSPDMIDTTRKIIYETEKELVK